MQIRFASVDIDIIIHATEDHLKMLSILQDVLKIDPTRFTINRLEGHHGNEIILMRCKLNTEGATQLAYHIIDSLNIYDKKRLLDNLSKHIERNSLYIRLSKQDLFRDRIAFAENDAIKIRFRIKGFKPSIEFENLKEILSEEHG